MKFPEVLSRFCARNSFHLFLKLNEQPRSSLKKGHMRIGNARRDGHTCRAEVDNQVNQSLCELEPLGRWITILTTPI